MSYFYHGHKKRNDFPFLMTKFVYSWWVPYQELLKDLVKWQRKNPQFLIIIWFFLAIFKCLMNFRLSVKIVLINWFKTIKENVNSCHSSKDLYKRFAICNLLFEDDVIKKLRCDQSNSNFQLNFKNLIDFAVSYLRKCQTITLSRWSWKTKFLRFVNVPRLCVSMETILRKPSTLLHQKHQASSYV